MGKREKKLLEAVSANDLEKVKSLLKPSFLSGVIDLAAEDGVRSTALMMALGHDRVEIARLLIESGVNVNVEDEHGYTLLGLALEGYDGAVAEFLIENGAEYDGIWSSDYGADYLMGAAYFGNIEAVEALLAKGMDINKQDSEGQTPLMWATQHRNAPISMVKLLIDAGANVSIQDHKGKTAADHARQRGAFAVASYVDPEGRTAVDHARQRRHAEIAKSFGTLRGAYPGSEALVEKEQGELTERKIPAEAPEISRWSEDDGPDERPKEKREGMHIGFRERARVNRCVNVSGGFLPLVV